LFNIHFSTTTQVSRHQNVSILDFIGAKDDAGGGDNWSGAIRHAKLQSDCHYKNQNPAFYRLDALPVAQPTVSDHPNGKLSHFMSLLILCSPGSLPIFAFTIKAADYLVDGCHSSHQPSDASTPK